MIWIQGLNRLPCFFTSVSLRIFTERSKTNISVAKILQSVILPVYQDYFGMICGASVYFRRADRWQQVFLYLQVTNEINAGAGRKP